ncbi:MAG: HAMP domain-containing sensor histidine kinase [Acidobacteriota bacterium]|nr:HAMP domain-containing sensor histidine kinase [Acidobacteriota bacterium]
MGRGLRRWREQYSRTLLALALTTVAVALPSTALYVAGEQATRRDADQRRRAVDRRARRAAESLATKLHQRLEALLANEDRRPFYHYQNLYHDPRGAHRGPSVVPSPLAQGPADPLIRSHFQIGPDGRVSLPTVNLELPEMSCVRQRERHMAMLRSLQPAAPICCEDDKDPMRAKLARRSRERQEDFPSRVVRLDEIDWLQNLEASEIYARIKQGGVSVGLGERTGRQVEIRVEGFRWKTVPLEEGASLVALRRVLTPVGLLTQGFVVCNEAMGQWLEAAPMPARFARPDSSGDLVFAPLHLPGVDWGIAVDPRQELQQAAVHARAASERFHRLFVVLTLAAALAGGLAVVVVWQAERLARQRSRFAASAAHELRTPLASLRMYGEMLADGLGNPARSRDYARRVAGEAERLGRVVSNVLGFSRLEQGLLKVDPQPGDLGAAVRDHVARIAPALEQAGATVEVEVEDALPAVCFDHDALGQILQNLLDNAEKYSRGCEDRRIRVRVRGEGSQVVVQVVDHGPGIPAELRGRLFEAFSRGSNTDVPEGLGLGLMLTRSLARLQGARVQVANGKSGGAVMSVFFPG